jgi:hypothetical protein
MIQMAPPSTTKLLSNPALVVDRLVACGSGRTAPQGALFTLSARNVTTTRSFSPLRSPRSFACRACNFRYTCLSARHLAPHACDKHDSPEPQALHTCPFRSGVTPRCVMGALHGVDGHFALVPPPVSVGFASLSIGSCVSELTARRAGDEALRPAPVVTLSAMIA